MINTRKRKSAFSPLLGLRLLSTALLLSLAALAGGCTTFPMRGQQVWRSAVRHDYPSHPVGTPEFEAALDAYTETEAHAGCSARLLHNGDEVYPAMLALIESARTRISLETYIIEDDNTTNVFFRALLNAAARGVQVRVLVDAAGFHRGLLAQLDELRQPGIQGRVFNPFFLSWTIVRGNNRDHRKILVVDGAHAILGGVNISDKQLGDGTDGWRDTALLVSGSVAEDAERVFAETWNQAGRYWLGRNLPLTFLNPLKLAVDEPLLRMRERTCGPVRFQPPPFSRSETECPPLPEGYDTAAAAVRVVASSPDRRNSATYDLAILGLNGARERADLTYAYFVPPLGLRRALLAAAGRGVKVRLLLPGVTDVGLVRELGLRFYGELLAAGIEIYEWPYPILHAKTMVVDGRWLVVGSANMDSRSYFLNYEANLAVTDAALATLAHERFERDLGHAQRITLDMWRRRGARQRIIEVVTVPLAGQY